MNLPAKGPQWSHHPISAVHLQLDDGIVHRLNFGLSDAAESGIQRASTLQKGMCSSFPTYVSFMTSTTVAKHRTPSVAQYYKATMS